MKEPGRDGYDREEEGGRVVGNAAGAELIKHETLEGEQGRGLLTWHPTFNGPE